MGGGASSASSVTTERSGGPHYHPPVPHPSITPCFRSMTQPRRLISTLNSHRNDPLLTHRLTRSLRQLSRRRRRWRRPPPCWRRPPTWRARSRPCCRCGCFCGLGWVGVSRPEATGRWLQPQPTALNTNPTLESHTLDPQPNPTQPNPTPPPPTHRSSARAGWWATWSTSPRPPPPPPRTSRRSKPRSSPTTTSRRCARRCRRSAARWSTSSRSLPTWARSRGTPACSAT